jgi:hypothetical protein
MIHFDFLDLRCVSVPLVVADDLCPESTKGTPGQRPHPIRRGNINGSLSICPAADESRVLLSSVIGRRGYVATLKTARNRRIFAIDRALGARPICLSTPHPINWRRWPSVVDLRESCP